MSQHCTACMPSLNLCDVALAVFLYPSIPRPGTFVETGTCRGDTVRVMEPHFDTLHTVELSPQLHQHAKEAYKGNKISFHLGDSTTVLPSFLGDLEPAVFFLDGHFSHGETAQGDKDCPLLEELSSIAALYLHHGVLIIDDARLFGTNQGEDWSAISEQAILDSLGGRVHNYYYMSSPLHPKDRLVVNLKALTAVSRPDP